MVIQLLDWLSMCDAKKRDNKEQLNQAKDNLRPSAGHQEPKACSHDPAHCLLPLVVRIPGSHPGGPDSIPGLGTRHVSRQSPNKEDVIRDHPRPDLFYLLDCRQGESFCMYALFVQTDQQVIDVLDLYLAISHL